MKRQIGFRNNPFFVLTFLLLIFTFQVYSEEIKVSQDSTFCFVGDTGNVTEVQKEVAEALANSDCSVIWHTGDIIYPDGISSKDDPRFITNFLDPFKKVFDKRIPFFLHSRKS